MRGIICHIQSKGQFCWSSKNLASWLDKKHTCQNPAKTLSLRLYLLHAKRIKISFLSSCAIIKESCNLTGWKAHLAAPNQKWESQMLALVYDYLHAKKNTLRHQLILSKDIDDQSIPSVHTSLQFWNPLTFPGFAGKM